MEAILLIALFASNIFALECLYHHKEKTTGILLIVNLLLTVCIAYQFKQIQNIFYILLAVAGVVVAYYGIKFYLKKKNATNIMIEEKDDYNE